MPTPHRALALLFTLLVALLPGRSPAVSADSDPLYAERAPLGKVSRVLLQRAQRSATTAEAGSYRVDRGAPELDIRLNRLDPDIVEELLETGLRILDTDYRHARVLGTCDDCFAALEAVAEVTAVHPNYGARTSSGNVLSQGDGSMRADQARAVYGLSGDGVHVGVLSDTFSQNTTGSLNGGGCNRSFVSNDAADAAELPVVRLLAEPSDFEEGRSFVGIDEGRALVELIYDVAPGATISYHTAFVTESIFARGIDALVDCGADILVDDVIYFAEPMFQDGPVAQAARRATESGVLFFSAIGNLGPWGVDERFTDFSEVDDEASPPSGEDFHLFANGSRWARIDLPPRCGLRMVMQWNEPFSGQLGSGAISDLDLYACPGDDPLVRCDRGDGGTDAQGCSRAGGGPGGDPIEIMDIRPRSGSRTVYVAVDHVCGNQNVRFRIVSFALGCNFPSTFEFDEQVFNQSQTYGHPAGAGVLATAAVEYPEIDSDGEHQAPAGVINVEPFSSSGGNVPIYFDDHGAALPGGPVTRRAPFLSAPDGTNTSFFGLRDSDDDGLLNFFGTSAAAPHAAAVAALMLEADPTLERSETEQILRLTAHDIESPGFDTASGYGLVDALDAIGETFARLTASPTPSATATPTNTETPTGSPISPCPADCNGDRVVLVNEIVTAILISLDSRAIDACPAADRDGDGVVRINELVAAVAASLDGC